MVQGRLRRCTIMHLGAGKLRRRRLYARSCKQSYPSPPSLLECTIIHSTSPVAARIATHVRRTRDEQGLRQDELALAAGVSVRSVHHIEAGKPTTRLDILERVLHALGLTIEVTARRSNRTLPQA